MGPYYKYLIHSLIPYLKTVLFFSKQLPLSLVAPKNLHTDKYSSGDSFTRIAVLRITFSKKTKENRFKYTHRESVHKILGLWLFLFGQGVDDEQKIDKHTYIRANIGISTACVRHVVLKNKKMRSINMQNFALKIYGSFSRLGTLRVTFNKNVLDILMRHKF